MQTNAMNEMVVSLDAAWLCAAERDIEREEEDRMALLARAKMQSIKGKYELDATAQLDADLKHQQLELRKRAAKRRQQQPSQSYSHNQQLPVLVDKPPLGSGGSSGHTAPPHSPQEQQRQNQTKKPMAKPSIYELENQRLAALVNHKQSAKNGKASRIKTVPMKKKAQPRIVDDMLALERRYAMSARVLQRWWRAHLRTQFWKSFLKKNRAATKIQRMVRGFVCRCVVRTWHRNRTHRATRIQAALRGFLMRRVINSWKQWEYVNTVRIQSIVRGHFGRRRAKELRRNIAALHIQSLWRGNRGRRRADLLWLAVKAIELQRLVRGMQTRKRVHRRRRLYNEAATQIQRVFRGTQARAMVDKILRDRETTNRREWMLMLEVEEEWHRKQRDRLQSRLERFRLYDQLCDLEDQYYRAHERVNDMEAIYLDMQSQRLRVSPRAIEQGWVEEMEQKMRAQREAITQAKLDVVFDLGLRFKRKEEEFLELMDSIRVIEDKRRRFEIARDEEFLDYWERECKYQHELKQIEKKRRIADTKRKFRVQFYHFNGKKDKRWRGTHWTRDVLEEAKRREIFCLSNTNLLAAIEAKWRNHLQMTKSSSSAIEEIDEDNATRERLRELEEQVALVAANAQTQQTIAIFDPVFRDIEERFERVKDHQQKNETRSQSRKAERKAAALRKEQEVEKWASEHHALAVVKVDSVERQLKLRKGIQASRIPWHMLDQLAAERRKLEEEKAMFKVWRKVHPSMFAAKSSS